MGRASSGYIIAGGITDAEIYAPLNQKSSNSSLQDLSDAWLVKTDDSGEMEWSRKFEYSPNNNRSGDYFKDVEVVSDGYIFLGATRMMGIKNDEWMKQWWVLKTDFKGREVWNNTLELGDIELFSVHNTPDGGFVVGGDIGGETQIRCTLIKLKPELQDKGIIEPITGMPGFQVVFAVAGLVVAYLVGRRR